MAAQRKQASEKKSQKAAALKKPAKTKAAKKTKSHDSIDKRAKSFPIVGIDATTGDLKKVLQELRGHQIELEMQNEELRQTQQQLKESRDRYTDLYDFAPVGYFTFNKKSLVIEANLTGCQILDAERKNLIKKPFHIFVGKESRDRFNLHLQDVFNTSVKKSCEITLVRKDKTTFEALFESVPAVDDKGEVILCRTTITDITESKRMQAEIESMAKFPAENPFPVLRLSKDGEILYSNTPGKILLEQWSCKISQKAPQDWCSLVSEALKSKSYLVKEVNCGNKIYSCAIAPVPGGGYVNLYGRDITKQKQYESELRRSRDELEMRVRQRTVQLHQQASLLELANDAIIVRDPDDKITFWNQGAVETYGWTKEQSLGKKTHTLLKTEFPRLLEEIEAELNKRERWEGELVHTRSDGTQIIVASRWVLQRDDQGSPVGILQINRDITERRRAEEAVKAERKRFEDVLEMMPAYALLLTPDYHVAYANLTFRNWFGDDNGKKCYEFLFNRKEPCETCETYTVLKTGNSHFWEWSGPNGRNYDIYDYPFIDSDGSSLIMEIGVDVTAHKQTQIALRSTSLYARGLLEAALDPLVTISADGKITDVNDATIKVTGVPREQLIGTDFSNYFTEPKKAREGYKRVFAEGFVTNYSLTIKHSDGRLTDVFYNATVYKNEAGQIQGVFAAARDVTAQKQASQYARSLIEASLDPLVTISADGKITDVNEATIKVTGIPREQLISTDFSDYFTEPQKAREGYQRVFAEGFVTDYPLTIRHRNGHLTDVLYNATVYKDTHAKVAGVFAAARDITELKRAEKRRRVTNDLLEQFATKTSRKKYLDSVVETIRLWSGCRCVGIRLTNADGYIPYESYAGFSGEFLSLENELCLKTDSCLCIRAVSQTSRPQDSTLLTAKGSFRSNNSLEFIKSLPDNAKKQYRGNCMRFGFASLAVIPIRYRDKILGAIHLADENENKVPMETVVFLEDMAALIGEAVHRFNVEESLRLNEKRLLEAQRFAHLGNWELDIAANRLWWSDEVYRIFGLEPRQLDAGYDAFLSYVHPGDRNLVEESVNKALYDGQSYDIDHRIIRPDGNERIVNEKAEVIYDSNHKPVKMAGTVYDITEQKKAENEIRENQRALRALAAELQIAEERERRLIAADLHDSIGQILAFSGRELKTLQKSLPEKTAKSLMEIANQLDIAVEQSRNLSFDLSPSMLYDLGFEVAVEDLVDRMARERKIQCRFENCRSPKPLSDDVKVLLYRSVRELLINAAKHANAGLVKVSLLRSGSDISIQVEDDGRGFDASILNGSSTKTKGFGIFSIRERLSHIGGRMKIESTKGKGTRAVLIAPLDIEKEDGQEMSI